ncbi:ATP-dependent helicase [Paenibacillus hubeiensis]|uniref:ATP-dependent helicase n=1 Tax=Paenibacillus hubeiensis TaxID=3077330 RepID=UPI0031BAB62B
MKFTDIHKWEPSDGLTLEPAALQVVKSQSNSLVVAGPGAGKTELLAQRACYLLETNTCKAPRRILAISFKKDAAKNLAERVEKRCGKELSKRFKSMTYDAFAKSLVDRFFLGIPAEYRPTSIYEIADQNDIKTAYEYTGYNPPVRSRPSDIKKILDKEIVKYALPLPPDGDYPTKAAWSYLLYNNVTSRLSFSMLTRLATYLLSSNPLLIKYLQLTYSHIFLDEFQDTTNLQYDLVKTCFHNSSTIITAVGDNKQRIMVWAGAMRNIFPAFTSDFNASTFRLIMNHRSAPRLVEIQKVFFSRFNEAPLPIQTNPRWGNTDGQAYLHLFENQRQESITIADLIQKYLSDGSHKPNEICILVKQSVDKYCSDLISELQKRNIQARNEGVYQDFLREDYVSLCIHTLILAIKRDATSWSYCRELFLDMKSIDETSSNIHETQTELSYFIKDLKSEIKLISSKEDIHFLIEKIKTFYSIDAIRAYFPQYSRSNYIDRLSTQLSNYLWDEYNKAGSLKAAIYNLLGHNSVPIMTIHKSKGLEYKTIIFLALEDAAFFSFKSQKEEDTAAFFVALSRAKNTLHFTFSKIRQMGHQNREVIEDFYKALDDSGVVESMVYD